MLEPAAQVDVPSASNEGAVARGRYRPVDQAPVRRLSVLQPRPARRRLRQRAPNAAVGSQQTAQMMEDDILSKPIPIAEGPKWRLIEEPGLGVEVDEDKLRRFDEDFRKQGDFVTCIGKVGV
jgi:hypothetical protein